MEQEQEKKRQPSRIEKVAKRVAAPLYRGLLRGAKRVRQIWRNEKTFLLLFVTIMVLALLVYATASLYVLVLAAGLLGIFFVLVERK